MAMMVPDRWGWGARPSGKAWPLLREQSASRSWLLWLAGTAIASVPFLLVTLPPLNQHFFNVVRLQILADPAAFAQHFEVHWDMVPDLALDLIVPKMAALMPVERATWLVLLGTLALLSSGAIALSRAVNKRWSLLPFVSFLFLYNWILVRGYENNLLGLALSLWALAAHVSLRNSALLRAGASICSALLLYFCHLFPLGVFAAIAGSWEFGVWLHEGPTLRRGMKHAAVALLPLALPVLLLRLSSTGELSGVIEFGLLQPWAKAKLSLEAFTVGDRVSDVLLLASLGLTAALAAGRRWFECEPECRVAVVVIPLIAFVAPFYAFAAWGITERYGVTLAFLLVAFLRLRPVDLSLQRAAGALLTFVFLFRIGAIAADWRQADRTIGEYRMALATLKPGSVLLQFDWDTRYFSPLRDPDRWNPPLSRVMTLATLHDVLVPELYLKRGQQPVLFRGPDAALRQFQYDSDRREGGIADDGTFRAWLRTVAGRFPDLAQRFSAVYVAVYDPHPHGAPAAPGLELIRALPEHYLYRLVQN
ncbi:MAG: hypothetical protein JOZ42_15860 [Acetobacteraceae bacterium]|nr:hypothetical protein [Acetobacteraceae bacterium]